jgi:tRNA A-37 threonylcarbamoyl transferase component Bud32
MYSFYRGVILDLIRRGELITEKTINGRVVYAKKYREVASSSVLRRRRKMTPIVMRGDITPDGTIARHTVYKVIVKGVPLARKTYLDVDYRVHVATCEAAALIEAARRGIPVVDFVRLSIMPRNNLAVLYTRIPKGFITLANSRLGFSANPKKFLEELGKTVGRMHNKGFFHGALDAENILWNRHPKAPEFMFLDLEGARFYDKKPLFSQVGGDIGVLIESLCAPFRGLGVYTRTELDCFINAYCNETGYPKEEVLKVIESAFPSQPLQEVRENIRSNLLRRLGLEP